MHLERDVRDGVDGALRRGVLLWSVMDGGMEWGFEGLEVRFYEDDVR